jgi:predicted acetyltransferase
MNIKLVVPTLNHKEEALAYRKEHFDNNETIINGSELLDKIDSYEEWLEKINKNSKIETVDSNWVLTDTFFAIREDDNKIIGIIDLRHTLNDFLKNFGNSGYSVRPSERNKGYATKMLKLLIEYAKRSGRMSFIYQWKKKMFHQQKLF